MRGAVLYGPRDVRIRRASGPARRADGCRHPAVSVVHLRLGFMAHRGLNAAVNRSPWATSLRHRRRCRSRRHVDPAGSVRDRIVRRLRQHLPALSSGLSNVVCASAVGGRCAGAVPPRADGGRHARRDAGVSPPRIRCPAFWRCRTYSGPGGSRPMRRT